MPWRRTARQPPVWIRPFGVSTVADFLADLQAQKSHILYPLLLLVRAFFQANSKHLGTLLTILLYGRFHCVLCTRAGACPHHYTSSSSPPHTTTGRFVHHRHRPRVHLPHTVVHPPFLKSVVLGRVTWKEITQKSDPLFLLAWPWFMIFVWLSTSSLW